MCNETIKLALQCANYCEQAGRPELAVSYLRVARKLHSKKIAARQAAIQAEAARVRASRSR